MTSGGVFFEELEIKLKQETAGQSESTNRAAFTSTAVIYEVEGTAIETGPRHSQTFQGARRRCRVTAL